MLAGIGRIEIVIEPDKGGETLLAAVARAPFRDRVWLVSLGGDNDPSGLYLRDPERFEENWQAAVEAAPKWTEIQADERTTQATADFQKARYLLDDPNLMQRISEVITARGYAGDTGPPRVAYVAITSRLLTRPCNLAIVAQSASGKNAALDAGRALHPEEAVHEIKAGSERAMIYDEADYQHRVVIFAEADSIPEEGSAASAVRNVATDNVMAYDTVEKNPETGRMETRHIRKPGPTGLITTSTKSLDAQMTTRMLEMPISDDAAQTLSILEMQAEAAASTSLKRPDVEPLLALQRWLENAGRREVTIPFAQILPKLVPAKTVRMRRDFCQLLTFIAAVALLHQRQRAVKDGHIVATLDDYAITRDLLAPIFDTVAAEGCTPAVRATVEAVKDGEEVSGTTLAQRLGLAPSTVSYRVRRAIKGGWLVNHESSPGRAARYARGGPLPDGASALPSVETVRKLFECSSPNPTEEAPPPPSYKEF